MFHSIVPRIWEKRETVKYLCSQSCFSITFTEITWYIHYMSENEEKRRLTKVTSHLADKGLIAPLSGGAISVRAGKHFIITSDTFNPYDVNEKDMLTANIADGIIISKNRSRNALVHAQIYQKREDVNVIIYGAPVYATLLSASSTLPQTDLFVEAWKELGEVGRSAYVAEESSIFSGRIAMELEHANAVLVENYGAIVVASDLLSAIYRFELLEKVSKMTVEISKLELKPLSYRQKLEIGPPVKNQTFSILG